MFSLMLPETKSRQCDTSTSLRLASFRDPFVRKGNSVDTEETIIYLYKTSTTSVQVKGHSTSSELTNVSFGNQKCRILNLVVFARKGRSIET